jgi:hypothetical protein
LTGAAASREKIEKWFNRQGLALFVHGQAKRRSLRLGTRVGWLLATLILGPAVGALLAGQPVLAMTIAGTTVSLVVFVVFLLGTVIALAQWAIGEIRRQMFGLLGVLAQTLPFLFIGITILFLTAEVWQVAVNLRWQFLLGTLGVFLLVGTLCLATRLIAEVRVCCAKAEELSYTERVAHVRAMKGAAAIGLEQFDGMDPDQQWRSPPPEAAEKVNIGLLLFLAQNLQILGVSAALGIIFVAFGLFAIPPETAQSFLPANRSVHPVPNLPDLTLWGQEVVVTKELLKVTALVVGFSYLSFVFFAVTRDDYAEHFLKAVHTRIADALAVRSIYLTTLWAPRRKRVGRGRNYRLIFEVPSAATAGHAALFVAMDGQAMEEHQMEKRPDGGFSHHAIVPSGGRYRYSYVIDGAHQKDWGADEYGRDDTGAQFSVVAVPPARLESP